MGGDPPLVSAALTHDEAVARAALIAERAAARAAETEELRRLPDATIAEVTEADLWRLVTPRHLGGHGLGLLTVCEVGRTLAHGCASTAWTVSFLILHNWFVARFRPEIQAELFAKRPYVLMPAPLTPGGVAEPVEGGHRLSGRWSWASGVMHADWVVVLSFVPRDGARPAARVFLLPVDHVEVDDVWRTSGMRGTGSNDVVADSVFVPERLSMPASDLMGDDPPGAAAGGDAFVGYPLAPVLVLYAASTAVGAAEAAVDQFRELVGRRMLAGAPGLRQADQPVSQARLGEALATVRAARLVWRDAIERLCSVYDAGGRLARAERGSFRLAAAHAVKLSVEAVRTSLDGAGASAYLTSSPLQRIQRDLETLKGHVVYDWDRAATLAGRLELGGEATPVDLL
ncbi:MAG: acyl-CoA dehydrogenase family protein [Acidimicrobiales bacterium]